MLPKYTLKIYNKTKYATIEIRSGGNDTETKAK